MLLVRRDFAEKKLKKLNFFELLLLLFLMVFSVCVCVCRVFVGYLIEENEDRWNRSL